MNLTLIMIIVAFVILLLLSVPVGVILLAVSLVPAFLDPGFSVDFCRSHEHMKHGYRNNCQNRNGNQKLQ